MGNSFLDKMDAAIVCIFLFLAMFILFLIGRRIRRHWKITGIHQDEIDEPLQPALFALFGFILAFAFGMSGNHYNNIRSVFVEEANAISTAILRADMYSDSVRIEFRKDFRNYLEARISLYSNLSDSTGISKFKNKGEEAGKRIWARAMAESKLPDKLVASYVMIPSLNAMFDVATKREEALKNAVPNPIYYMVFVMALVSSFAAGLVSSVVKTKDWIIIISYFIFSSLVIFITVDLGRPLQGLIRAEHAENSIVALRDLLKD